MNSKQSAILVVSFGTAVRDTRVRTIEAIERKIEETYPDLAIYHAWTSGMLRKKVYDQEQLAIDSVPQALARMKQDGIHNIVIQPTFVSHGGEYQKMVQDADPFLHQFASVRFGQPLLSEEFLHQESAEAASHPIISAIMSEFSWLSEDDLLVFMGHGTSSGENVAYEILDQQFKCLGYEQVFLKLMKSGSAIDEIIQIAADRQIHRIILAPFMIVAGGHALKDMSGDTNDSWKSRLEAAGFPVQCHLKGLGEYPGIQEIFATRR